jgi:hypothetical protein
VATPIRVLEAPTKNCPWILGAVKTNFLTDYGTNLKTINRRIIRFRTTELKRFLGPKKRLRKTSSVSTRAIPIIKMNTLIKLVINLEAVKVKAWEK